MSRGNFTRRNAGRVIAAIVLGALLPLVPAQGQQGAPASARVIQLSAGIHVISAEVAADDPTRMKGLMYRRELAPNHGMLFIFDGPATHCMWMKNTLIPLSVAFIDGDGKVANIEDMQAQTETTHCAAHPVPYALEMGLGWFRQHGIGAGSTIERVKP